MVSRWGGQPAFSPSKLGVSLLANGFQLCVGGLSMQRAGGGPEGLPSEPGPPVAVGSGAHPDSRLEVLGGAELNLI